MRPTDDTVKDAFGGRERMIHGIESRVDATSIIISVHGMMIDCHDHDFNSHAA